MKAYQLYLRNDTAWDWIGTIEAPTHAEAFRQVLLSLGPDDHERPIRLETDVDRAYHKPIPRGREYRYL